MHTIKDVLIYRQPGDKVADPITVVFPWDYRTGTKTGTLAACIGMGETPFHPQGFCQHSECKIGAHLGKRISYVDLNDDCARVVREGLAAYNKTS